MEEEERKKEKRRGWRMERKEGNGGMGEKEKQREKYGVLLCHDYCSSTPEDHK